MMLSDRVPARSWCMQSSQLRIPLGQGCFAELPLHSRRMVSRSFSIASCATCRARGMALCARHPTSGASGPLPMATACTRCSCASRCAPVHCCRCGSVVASASVLVTTAFSALCLLPLLVALLRSMPMASSCVVHRSAAAWCTQRAHSTPSRMRLWSQRCACLHVGRVTAYACHLLDWRARGITSHAACGLCHIG